MPLARGLSHRKVAVTGAGGFLGSAVVRALLRHGAEVRAHVGPPGFGGQPLPPAATCMHAEITDTAACRSIVAGCDAVVHLAGPPSVRASFESPFDYAKIHVGGTAACLQACVLEGTRRIVYVSSADVYGRAGTRPVTEDHGLDPRSPYAAAKIGAERMIEAFVHAYGTEAFVLRPFSIFGPGQSPYSLVSTIVGQARGTGDVVLADLQPVRDYCFVDDVAEAITLACANAPESPCVVNVGSGTGTSVAQLAGLILRIVGRSAAVREREGARRPGDSEITHLVADTTKIRSILGWQPRYDLEAGLREVVAAAAS